MNTSIRSEIETIGSRWRRSHCLEIESMQIKIKNSSQKSYAAKRRKRNRMDKISRRKNRS